MPDDSKCIEYDIQLTDKVNSVEKLRSVFICCPAICSPRFGPSPSLFRHFNQLIDRMPVENRLRMKMIRQFGRQLDKYPKHLVPPSSKLYLYSNLALVTHKAGTHTILTHDELGLKYDRDFLQRIAILRIRRLNTRESW